MSRSSLALLAGLVIVAAAFAQSPAARAQSSGQFEYVRVAPYTMHTPVGPNEVRERVAYRACVAGVTEWRCREFLPGASSTDAIRVALATLGNDGWELVSAVDEDPGVNRLGLTYLFKRPAR